MHRDDAGDDKDGRIWPPTWSAAKMEWEREREREEGARHSRISLDLSSVPSNLTRSELNVVVPWPGEAEPGKEVGAMVPREVGGGRWRRREREAGGAGRAEAGAGGRLGFGIWDGLSAGGRLGFGIWDGLRGWGSGLYKVGSGKILQL